MRIAIHIIPRRRSVTVPERARRNASMGAVATGQADVIKSAAERTARAMANEIAQKRSEERNRLMFGSLDVVLQLVAEAVPSDDSILQEIDRLKSRCLSFAAGDEGIQEGNPEDVMGKEPAEEGGRFAGEEEGEGVYLKAVHRKLVQVLVAVRKHKR